MPLPEGITPEMFEQLVNSPGQTLSGSIKEGQARTYTPSTSIPINEGQTAVRPQIGGHVYGKEKISRPSASLPQRLADGDAKMRAEAAAQLAEIKQREEEVSPDSILGRLAYLERNLKKTTAELNKLKKTQTNA